MRADCTNAIEELALSDSRVVVIASDYGTGFMPKLAGRYPERVMVEGICEQALIGVSAGLSSEGYYPFIFMLAVFGTRRCYEQLLLDFALHRLSGCVVGAGGGLNYSALGPTHLAVDDFSLLSSIPGTTILAPGDPTEAALLPHQTLARVGLSYIRLSETTDSLNAAKGEVTIGKGRALSIPREVLFISCGAASLAVQSAISILNASEDCAAAIHLHTVRPLDGDLVCRYVSAARIVICVEEHRQMGGLSSAVLHAITAAGTTVPRFVSVSVGDEFPHGNGTYSEMLSHYGITGAALVDRARKLLSEL